ncbi:TIGR03088 family PEP-CTERM/XrtA system glycosyltransferase [Methylicorpusculum sp.]|uniref:TIGR03088 family PEP-CTERM/XrtA system glycosyltransferase n=1 Tax=Methylicorpusculum sp. TaxID=2713644 RepID=UPI0027195FC5|nr:TIGR03088 family PEP-CTERM/XrtA system glycosyltransferase [Methylicorpusculum sp.]MDO8846010.1 TIGR03088 family PEP-CTERM/XrtA system glycosyltransferase [Methylicorpusculum sp.]
MNQTLTEPPLIAHVIYSFGVGGLENGLVNLINRIPKEKYRHAIICLKASTDFSKRLQRDDVAIYELNKKEGHDLASFVRMYRLLREIQPAIVHTRNLAAIEYQIPALLAGIKRRVHGEHGWDVFDPDGTQKKYQRLRRLMGLIIQRFIPLSGHLERYLIEKAKIPASKVQRICNGVDTEKFFPAKDAKHCEQTIPFQLNENTVIIGAVGRMHGVKDQITLVNAFINLCHQYPELKQSVRLVIIGDGPLRNEALELLKQHELTEWTWLPGERDDIADLMRCFDVFVLPSKAEGISNTILEAMATGLPVIATRVGGNPELVINDVTGRLVQKENAVEMANAINEYVTDKQKRLTHGENGLKRIHQEFSLNIMVEHYLSVYDYLAD